MQPTRWSSAFEILQRRMQRREEDRLVEQELRGEAARGEGEEDRCAAEIGDGPVAVAQATFADGRPLP